VRIARLWALAGLLAVAACDAGTPARTELANPASENCIAKGGELRIETAGNGGQYGLCLFEDNRQCEEWALLRGTCPVGGRKVTGYVTPQARYCAIRGGDYAVTSEQTATTPEQGACTLPGEPICDALALYEGRCS
jgi:putative hemolysin